MCIYEFLVCSAECTKPLPILELAEKEVNPSLSELSESPEDRFCFFSFVFFQFYLNISLVSLGVFSCPSPPKCDVVRR